MLSPNTPSLSGFALFASQKNPDERYDWCRPSECAVALYLDSLGLTRTEAEKLGVPVWSQNGPHALESLASGLLVEKTWDEVQANGARHAWTWGALHARILEALR